MNRLNIFSSEGGYRLCLATWGNNPIIKESPWYPTKAAAEAAKKQVIAQEARQARIEELLAAGDIAALNAL